MSTEQIVTALATFSNLTTDLSVKGLTELRDFLSCQEGRIAAIDYLNERLEEYEP